MISAVLVISGFVSAAVGYYAKTETRKMVKAELIEPLKDFSKQTNSLQNQMRNIEINQIDTDARLKLLLDLMKQNNNLLRDQKETIQELKK